MNDNKNRPDTGKEQDLDRARSGGGLGQGRETAAGMPEETRDKGRPGKGMGGTSDSGGRTTGEASDQQRDGARGPAPSPTTSDIRPSKAGNPGRTGGSGINISDHDGDGLDGPHDGAEWNRQRGMGGPGSRVPEE